MSDMIHKIHTFPGMEKALKETSEAIGVPQEFIDSGETYTGSSTALKHVEKVLGKAMKGNDMVTRQRREVDYKRRRNDY